MSTRSLLASAAATLSIALCAPACTDAADDIQDEIVAPMPEFEEWAQGYCEAWTRQCNVVYHEEDVVYCGAWMRFYAGCEGDDCSDVKQVSDPAACMAPTCERPGPVKPDCFPFARI